MIEIEDWIPFVVATVTALIVLLAEWHGLQLLRCPWFTLALVIGALGFGVWLIIEWMFEGLR